MEISTLTRRGLIAAAVAGALALAGCGDKGAAPAAKARLPTHINIRAADTGLAKDSVVLLEQIRTLDKHRLRERAGQITPEDQKRVDQALDVSLGLTSY